MGRWLTSYDMHSAKRVEEIHNSRIKRGEDSYDNFSRTSHEVCGCGAKGCIFISKWPKVLKKEKITITPEFKIIKGGKIVGT